MSVCLLLIHDGRSDCLDATLETLHMLGGWDATVVVDDSDHALGFAGAIDEGWRRIAALEPQPTHVFHLEADFRLTVRVPLRSMVALLDAHAALAQVSLKRQPWNERERAAGGIVEADPDDFVERCGGGHVWTEHRRYFTTNPSVYRTSLCDRGWPRVERSEGMFTHLLLDDPDLRFAIWGARLDPPRVEHVGYDRAGVGY